MEMVVVKLTVHVQEFEAELLNSWPRSCMKRNIMNLWTYIHSECANIQEGYLRYKTRWSLKSQRPTSQGVHREVLGPCVSKIAYKRAPKRSISFHRKCQGASTFDILKIHSRKMISMCGIDLKKIAKKMNGASGVEFKRKRCFISPVMYPVSLRLVLRKSIAHEGLVRGLHETAK